MLGAERDEGLRWPALSEVRGRLDGAAVLLLSVLVAVGTAGGSMARAGLMARVMGVPHVLCAAEDRFLPRFGVLREAALLHWH